MAKTGKKLTVANPDFIRNGDDADFRTMLHNLLTFNARMESIRSALGSQIGLTGGQWTTLQTVAQLELKGPVAVKDVADHLGQSGAFTTIEVNKLVEAKLLEKRVDPDDRRRVRLTLTDLARTELRAIAPQQAEVNDQIFEGIGGDDFDRLCRMAQLMRDGSEKALVLAQYLLAVSEQR